MGDEREKECVCEEEMGEKERAAAAVAVAAVAALLQQRGGERSFVELG